MNVKKVLVPVDFSPASRIAVNYGVSLARRLRARLALLNVVEHVPLPEFPDEGARLEKQHYDQAVRLLPDLLSAEDQDDLDVRTIVRVGEIEDQILWTVKDEQADLVVMGTHGRGFFARLFIGSVTQHVLRKVGVPIMTVCRLTGPLEFKRIVFATDLSEGAAQGFQFVLDLARAMKSEIVLLHTIEIFNSAYERAAFDAGWTTNARLEVQAKFDEFVAKAAAVKVPVECRIEEGVASASILKADADLIAITIKSKGIVERAMLGATAETVVREAHAPVLAIPVRPA